MTGAKPHRAVAMPDAVLTINAGSSSLKFSLWRVGGDGQPTPALEGEIEGIGTEPHMKAKDAKGQELVDRRWQDAGMDHAAFLGVLGDWLREQLGDARLAGVGHRVVHGGTEFAAPVRIDEAVLARLEKLCPLAPLHQPHNLAGIRAVAARPARPAAGRLLRYRLPPRSPRARRLVRPAAPLP